MSRIRLLPRDVIEKIAAGEVVERPASVVKELVENALDAGATRITVEIEEGGTKLIRVIDDGRGMSADDLPLAVASHATSKLASGDDLFHVSTFGFRGEALAAVGAVSHLKILTRAAGATGATGAEEGSAIEVKGGTVRPVQSAGAPVGTRVEVSGLFFNIPARRKFLRSAATEAAHVQDWVQRFALSNPKVAFFLEVDRRRVIQAFPAEDLAERARFVLGPEADSELVRVESTLGPLSLSGVVSRPAVFRTNAKQQMVFVNGRFVRDRIVAQAVRQAYETLVPRGKYPVAVLFLALPPDQVDVNVHPTKMEVRFRDASAIFPFVRRAISGVLRAQAPQIRLEEPAAGLEVCEERASFAAGSGRGAFSAEALMGSHAPSTAQPRRQFQEEIQIAPVPAEVRFLQIHRMFLVVETADGLEIFDQHALHERILYEDLKDKAESAGVESQRLLIPEVLEFSGKEMEALREGRQMLGTLGFDIGDFGENALAVHAAPALLVGRRLKDFFQLLLERWGDDFHVDLAGLREKMMRLVACQAAVKAGDHLAPDEVRSLLLRRSQADFPGCCQHGRPTSFRMPLKELEKKFLRR